MKGFSRTTIVILILLTIVVITGCSSYQNMVSQEVKVDEQWGNVENEYQARLNLIGNLNEVVAGAADFEKSTYSEVARLRSQAMQLQQDVNYNDLTPEKLQEIQQTQTQLSQATRGFINVVVERYPQLAATENFRDFQVQLDGIERRVANAHRDYNAAVSTYNTTIRKLPNNLWAGILGFEKKAFFDASPDANRDAPDVKF